MGSDYIKFNELKTRNDLADFLKVPRGVMTYVIYVKGVEKSYTSFEISKKSGEARIINAPTDSLKYIQKKISEALSTYQKEIRDKNLVSRNISHAFEKEKSIITNARIHKNKRFVLNLDLKDFFGSIHFGRVRGYFEKNKYFELPIELATVIAQLTCYNGRLPQGAPSSPIITNLICNILDSKLLHIAKKYKLDYTRYADDLTFSTNNKYFINDSTKFLKELNREITKSGFQINDNKTRLRYRDSRQEVTGLVVNDKISINRDFYKKTRAMAHSLYTKGSFKIDNDIGTLSQLEGRFSFINQIDFYNNKNKKKENNKNTSTKFGLNSREKEYKKFLFYKYFYANDKPLIVTEGKTDKKYLIAALKNLYKDYPDLISKKNTSFLLKITFLRKTDRFKYFFDLNKNGADTMKEIYNTYVDFNNIPSYWNYFNNLNGPKPSNPVIFIFDNENKDVNGRKNRNNVKPLKQFLNYTKKSHSNLFKDKLYERVIGNLFILTNPLVNNLDECEIEDLFDKKTLAHKHNGKTFKRDNDNINKYYGKEIFATYVADNYKDIDFNNFKQMLTSLSIISKKFDVNSVKNKKIT